MTPPTNSTDSPYSEEEEEDMNKLLRGIELAVEQELEDPGRQITRLEQEKLAYFAIQEFDIPITYSWYLAGANTRVAGEPSEAARRVETPSSPQWRDVGEDPDVRQYRDFFATAEFMPGYRLRDIWYTGKFDFLRDFYEHCAPEEFLDLYIVSTDIREQLENIDEIVQQEATNHSLSEWSGGSDDGVLGTTDESDFRLLISDLHIEISEIDDLTETVSIITRGTDVIEQVFAYLTELESVSEDQFSILNELSGFFYYDVWRYPALYISTQTAEGPNAHHLIDEHAERFTEFHEELVAEAEEMQNQCVTNDLYPGLGHHSDAIDESVEAHVNAVMRDIIEDTE